MVKLLSEILFSTLNVDKQQLALIENGIGSVPKKCEQANRNAAILESELLGDLHLIQRLGTTNQRLQTIDVIKGIASWNEDNEYVAKKLKEYDVNFGIVINQAPPLTHEFQINLSSKILYLLRETDFSTEKVEYIKNELSITKQGTLDLDATYALIQEQKIGKIPLKQCSLAGNIAEAFMQYAIADAVYQQGKKIRMHHSFQTKGREIQIDGNNILYKTPTEMDFILTYKRDEELQTLKYKLQEENKIHVIENKYAMKNSIRNITRR